MPLISPLPLTKGIHQILGPVAIRICLHKMHASVSKSCFVWGKVHLMWGIMWLSPRAGAQTLAPKRSLQALSSCFLCVKYYSIFICSWTIIAIKLLFFTPIFLKRWPFRLINLLYLAVNTEEKMGSGIRVFFSLHVLWREHLQISPMLHLTRGERLCAWFHAQGEAMAG